MKYKKKKKTLQKGLTYNNHVTIFCFLQYVQIVTHKNRHRNQF